MASMKPLVCSRCGEPLVVDGDFYRCPSCGALYESEEARKMEAILTKKLGEAKMEQLANARHLLYGAVHAKYPSAKDVSEAAKAVLAILQDDPMAMFYYHSHDGDPHEFIEIIAKLEVHPIDAKAVVEWCLRSLHPRVVSPLKDFVDRHFEGDEKTAYLTQLEEEAAKVDEGIYVTSLPRDVFLAYSSADMPKVIEMMDILEENGFACFAAFRNLRHGKGAKENYLSEIQKAIDHCKVFVFLSSNASRKPVCDALTVELPYLTIRHPEKARAEYLLEDYPDHMPLLVKKALKEAFPVQEHCRSVDDLLERLEGHIRPTPVTPKEEVPVEPIKEEPKTPKEEPPVEEFPKAPIVEEPKPVKPIIEKMPYYGEPKDNTYPVEDDKEKPTSKVDEMERRRQERERQAEEARQQRLKETEERRKAREQKEADKAAERIAQGKTVFPRPGAKAMGLRFEHGRVYFGQYETQSGGYKPLEWSVSSIDPASGEAFLVSHRVLYRIERLSLEKEGKAVSTSQKLAAFAFIKDRFLPDKKPLLDIGIPSEAFFQKTSRDDVAFLEDFPFPGTKQTCRDYLIGVPGGEAVMDEKGAQKPLKGATSVGIRPLIHVKFPADALSAYLESKKQFAEPCFDLDKTFDFSFLQYAAYGGIFPYKQGLGEPPIKPALTSRYRLGQGKNNLNMTDDGPMGEVAGFPYFPRRIEWLRVESHRADNDGDILVTRMPVLYLPNYENAISFLDAFERYCLPADKSLFLRHGGLYAFLPSKEELDRLLEKTKGHSKPTPYARALRNELGEKDGPVLRLTCEHKFLSSKPLALDPTGKAVALESGQGAFVHVAIKVWKR